MGLFGVGAIAAALIGGQLADQIGRPTIMWTALFGGAAILVAFSLVTAPLVVFGNILPIAAGYLPKLSRRGVFLTAKQRP